MSAWMGGHVLDANSRDDLNWTIGAFVYEFIVANARPPTVEETAPALGLARRWYGDWLQPDFRGRTATEARNLPRGWA